MITVGYNFFAKRLKHFWVRAGLLDRAGTSTYSTEDSGIPKYLK